MTAILWMICSCCGTSTIGRQWHNRDTGYGLCEDCGNRLPRKYDAAEMERLYGVRGINYAISDGTDDYERRVQRYEDQGLTRSDAQAAVDAEDMS